MEILLFVFFLLVFIGMLVGGTVIRKIKQAHKAAQQAADKREQQFRDEVGRKRQQYSQRAQPKSNQNVQSNQNTQSSQSTQSTEQQTARHTQTATGETRESQDLRRFRRRICRVRRSVSAMVC